MEEKQVEVTQFVDVAQLLADLSDDPRVTAAVTHTMTRFQALLSSVKVRRHHIEKYKNPDIFVFFYQMFQNQNFFYPVLYLSQ